MGVSSSSSSFKMDETISTPDDLILLVISLLGFGILVFILFQIIRKTSPRRRVPINEDEEVNNNRAARRHRRLIDRRNNRRRNNEIQDEVENNEVDNENEEGNEEV